MYAVIKAGSRQFKVSEGETLTIDRVPGNEGEKYTFSQVLMVGGTGSLKLGTPSVPGASVEATIKSQTKDAKVTIFKYKRRKNYKRTRGHRQPITILEIGKIKV